VRHAAARSSVAKALSLQKVMTPLGHAKIGGRVGSNPANQIIWGFATTQMFSAPVSKRGATITRLKPVHLSTTCSRILHRIDACHYSILTQTQNWGMLDADLEPVKPFPTYQERTSSLPRSEFLCLPKLPVELQIGILSCCDAPALYQSMQVSSNIREKDKRLFWSKGDAWYRVDGV
jgi:hypothetical protein